MSTAQPVPHAPQAPAPPTATNNLDGMNKSLAAVCNRSLAGVCLDFFWEAFLIRFCLRLLLPAMLALIASLLLGRAGDSYGVRELVFHDDGLKQFWSGNSLGLLTIGTLLGRIVVVQRPELDVAA